MGLPILVTVLFVKKFVALGAHKAAKDYGYPRIYRRLLEGLRKSNVGPEDKKIVRMTLKESLRFPTTAHRIFKSSETLKFLHFYKDNVLKNAGSAPDFFVSLAKDLEHNAGLIFGTAIRILTRK